MILFAADLHMDPLIWKGLPEVCGDAHDSWAQIVRVAVDQKVSALVLGGDVFDTHPPPETVSCFLKGIWQLRDCGIPVLAIQGQHGHSRNLPWSSIDPYVTDLENSQPCEIDGHVITGLDNAPPGQLQEELTKLDPKVDILVLHQMMRGMVPAFADREIWDCDPEWIPEHVKLVLLGDYHSPVARTFKGVKYQYNGSTVLRSITEPDDKFCHLVNDDLSITPIPLKTRPLYRYLFLMESRDYTDDIKKMEKHEDGSVIHVRHHPKIPELETRCRAAQPKAHFIFRPSTLQEEIVLQGPDDGQREVVSLRSCLDRVLKRENDPFLYDMLVNLLASEAPAEAIAALKQRFLEAEDADVSSTEDKKLLSTPQP